MSTTLSGATLHTSRQKEADCEVGEVWCGWCGLQESFATDQTNCNSLQCLTYTEVFLTKVGEEIRRLHSRIDRWTLIN